MQALSLAKECYSMKLDLLTNATVVDDAIRFVSQKSKGKIESANSGSGDDTQESKGPDYGEDKRSARRWARGGHRRNNNYKSDFLRMLDPYRTKCFIICRTFYI
jgi:hypothetical protein